MPASSNITSSTGRSDPTATVGGLPLVVRRTARARRITLAVDPRDGAVRLTLPPRAALAPALAWAEGRRAWIAAAVARVAPAVALVPGASFPLEGAAVTIDWQAAAPRAVVRDGATLRVGGPAELVPGRVLRWLKAQALAVLERETRALAARHGIAVGRVRVGDPRSRWGSCTAAGDIAYSWRLILAPPAVARATVAHEVAHRLHMDHGPAFHAAVERLYGRCPKPERAWLRAHGAALHGCGRPAG